MAVIGEVVMAVMEMSEGSERAICSVVVPESNITIWPSSTLSAASCASRVFTSSVSLMRVK